jgi:hypothetical protein
VERGIVGENFRKRDVKEKYQEKNFRKKNQKIFVKLRVARTLPS